MQGVRVFIDSNVLLYAHDTYDARKEAAAKAWLTALVEQQAALTNLQVLNELTAVLIRKKWFSSIEDVFRIVDSYATLGADPITGAEAEHARYLHRRFGYSWWDSILLASALELDCTHFLSEDLQDGGVVDDLTIVNPFRHEPATFFSSAAR